MQSWDGIDKFIQSHPKFGVVSIVEVVFNAGHRLQAQKYAEMGLKLTSSPADKSALEEMIKRLSSVSISGGS